MLNFADLLHTRIKTCRAIGFLTLSMRRWVLPALFRLEHRTIRWVTFIMGVGGGGLSFADLLQTRTQTCRTVEVLTLSRRGWALQALS